MWPKRAHFRTHLTDLSSKKFLWTDVHEHSFQQIKHLVAEVVMFHLTITTLFSYILIV